MPLVVFSAVSNQVHAQEVQYEDAQSQMEAVQYQIEGRLKESSDLFSNRIDQVGLNVVRSMALELLHGIAQKSGSIAPESKWIYAVRASHVWSALSILRNLALAYGDMKDIVAYSNFREQLKNEMQGLQQGQGIVNSISDFDAHAEDFNVE